MKKIAILFAMFATLATAAICEFAHSHNGVQHSHSHGNIEHDHNIHNIVR